jgi:hypothetical protein
MAIEIRGKGDRTIHALSKALAKYAAEHGDAEIAIYRRNPVSVRIRIIDPDFSRVSKGDRHDRIWQLLEELPESVQSEVSLLLLLTPAETEKSMANLEFDNPVPSRL